MTETPSTTEELQKRVGAAEWPVKRPILGLCFLTPGSGPGSLTVEQCSCAHGTVA